MLSGTTAARRLPLAVLLSAMLAVRAPAASSALPPSAAARSLAAWLDTLEHERDPARRVAPFYRMQQAFEQGGVEFGSTAQAEHFAHVMTRLMRTDTATAVSWAAGELMARFPHPATREALYDIARRSGGRQALTRGAALAALTALRDPRVLRLLEAELWKPHGQTWEALSLIADLGDPRGLAILRRFQADSSLAERCRYDPPDASARERERAELVAKDRARVLRVAAASAERDLRRNIADHLRCSWELDDTTYARVARQGFSLRDEGGRELYEFLGSEYPCVTSDVAFHTFVLVARSALGELDSLVIAPRLLAFCTGMGDACARIAAASPAGPVRDAAWRAAAYFAVPAGLLDWRLDADLPPVLADDVATDCASIGAHRAPGRSAVLQRPEDFTKYLPRSRLSDTPQLAGYFQAVTWLGRGNFHVDDDRELRQALVMTAAVRADSACARRWHDLNRLLGGLYGPADDLVFDAIPSRDPLAVAGDAAALKVLRTQLDTQLAPRINTAFAASWETWPSRERERGLRVLGSRYSRSADLFQQLLEHGAWPPSGLDIVAELMGSAQAAALPRLSRPSRPVHPAAPLAAGTGGLPEGSLLVLGTLFQPDARQPEFMQRPAWQEKEVNTALAGWAEMTNLTAPFMKDANIYLCSSPVTDRIHGWVEPVPRFYARLDSLSRALERRLTDVGAFAAIESSRVRALEALSRPPAPPSSTPLGRFGVEVSAKRRVPLHERDEAKGLQAARPTAETFAKLSAVLERLEALAEQELRGEPQSIDDGAFLKSLHWQLKALAGNLSNSEQAPEPMAVVTDPATESFSGRCLEVGTGRPRAIYVAVHDGDWTYVCRGAVYSYHEFTVPITDRLDDGTWKRQVEKGVAPPAWMESRPALAAQRHPTRY